MARPNGTYPYETLIRHTPDGLAISHRTITLFDGREFIGDPLPLTGEGVTELKDPALTALAADFSAAAVDALAASDGAVKQIETLTAEKVALAAQVAKLETAVAALGTTEQGLALAAVQEIERLEKVKQETDAKLVEMKAPK